MDAKRIGDRIRRLRETAKITQEGVAFGAKIATRALQRVEAGDGNPTLSTLLGIADALGVSLEELTGKTSRRLMAESLVRQVDVDQGMLAGAYILDCLARAEPIRRLAGLYIASKNNEYLEDMSKHPGGAQVAQLLRKLPLAV